MEAVAAARYARGYQPMGSGLASQGDADQPFPLSVIYWFAGTAAILTLQLIESRVSTSNAPIQCYFGEQQHAVIESTILERTTAEDLARIREVLKPAVLELANLFGVSRQAVYDWQDGAQPAPETALRLAKLARAADVFASAGVLVDSRTLKRRVLGGGTVLQTVLEGGNAEQVARSLVPTLRREASQRESLSKQLAGREHVHAEIDDYGSPVVAEDE
jgi:DNA-binding transcriptional regulator YiaG